MKKYQITSKIHGMTHKLRSRFLGSARRTHKQRHGQNVRVTPRWEEDLRLRAFPLLGATGGPLLSNCRKGQKLAKRCSRVLRGGFHGCTVSNE